MPTQEPKWQRIESPNLPIPRVGGSLVLNTKNRNVLLFGGTNSTMGYLDDIWSSNGSQWERKQTPVRPAARYGMSLVWDESRQTAILFGGMKDGELFGDTWQFNGDKWVPQRPLNSPSPRINASIAYDIARGRTILFGGKANTGERFLENLNEMWIWDSENWQQLSSINLPPARSGANLVYDGARQSVVLFGGQAEGRLLDDTWLWDGEAWTEQQPIHRPPARDEFGMTYHDGRQQVILFGGQSYEGMAIDTWVWDGKDWSQLQTTQSPPPQVAYGAQLAYLPALQAVVLYNAFREKTIVSDESFTMTERSEVWVLDY